MVSLSNKYLVVLDPGLRELGGHHPASIKSIAQASQHLTDCRLLVYCNQQCPAEFAQQLENYLLAEQQQRYWRVEVDEQQQLVWQQGEQTMRLNPEQGGFKRFSEKLYRLLGIKYDI